MVLSNFAAYRSRIASLHIARLTDECGHVWRLPDALVLLRALFSCLNLRTLATLADDCANMNIAYRGETAMVDWSAIAERW